MIESSNLKLEKAIKDEYDKKIKELTSNHTKMLVKIQPVSDLTQNGKSLPLAILDYIMGSDGIAAIIEKSRNEILDSK